MTIFTPDDSEVTEIVLPDGSQASEVVAPDGSVVWTAAADIPDSALYYWAVDEGSGQTLTDSVGSADITLSGGVSWVSDSASVGGYKIDLDGTDDKGDAQVPIAGQAEVLTCATIETTDANNNRILSWGETNAFGVIYAQVSADGTVRLAVGDGSAIVTVDSTTAVDDGLKHRVGLRILENTEIGVAVDGTVEGTTSFSTKGPVDDAFGLGYSRLNSNSHLNAAFDNPVVFSDASDSQITDDYNNQPWS